METLSLARARRACMQEQQEGSAPAEHAGVVCCSGTLPDLKSAFACASQRERRRVSRKRSRRQHAMAFRAERAPDA